MRRRHFDVFADVFQFLVMDSGADWTDLWSKWTPSVVDGSLIFEGHSYVGVATARDTYVPVDVVVVDEGEPIPGVEPGSVVREATLEVTSSSITVTGLNEEGSGGSVVVPAGRYAMRVEYLRLDSVDADGRRGDDAYIVTMCKEPPRAAT